MNARTGKRTKDEAVMIRVAKSIGSTLGTIAAKADAAQKALTRSSAAHIVKREGKMLMRKSKGVTPKTKNAVARNLKRSKLARATRRGLRRATSSAKRAARRGTAKARAVRRVRARK
jgi:hypothetical protein